ncbi:hypothetical protein [Legionella oakridgensis]|uniref:Uncharacterized protein n=2 Tax=Legionella oakridgensis TaxID=29423 RepID=W0BAW1_9GAMM|nr:hypothetical protein [Legionella oakridgensis]AHE67683.1 hypothetical protein Loa_02140 [Legionella oakridgensis ATCC 33761 = DSM 21215]ETO92778.1 hypothetical protein LOR_74c21430 [Legionella oakridgensis RV-2-2007]KTD36983.1 hypothetical protein Loak_2119 [Legionella oakridgensis]STY20708.1 Uncharacterised protein [Legionella longbeachae]
MSHQNIQKSAIEQALERSEFSRAANLSQLMIDWPRMKHYLYINGQSLQEHAEEVGIDLAKILESPHDPILQAQFKKLLDPLIPAALHDKDQVYDQLAQVLHQGGLPTILETELQKSLNSEGMMLDNVKRGMERRTDLIPTDEGFIIKELFVYQGNLSRKDPDNPEYVQKPGKAPILSGKCIYEVAVSKSGIELELQEMQLSATEKKLEMLLMPPPDPIRTTHTMKEGLQRLKTDTDEPFEERMSPAPSR